MTVDGSSPRTGSLLHSLLTRHREKAADKGQRPFLPKKAASGVRDPRPAALGVWRSASLDLPFNRLGNRAQRRVVSFPKSHILS